MTALALSPFFIPSCQGLGVTLNQKGRHSAKFSLRLAKQGERKFMESDVFFHRLTKTSDASPLFDLRSKAACGMTPAPAEMIENNYT